MLDPLVQKINHDLVDGKFGAVFIVTLQIEGSLNGRLSGAMPHEISEFGGLMQDMDLDISAISKTSVMVDQEVEQPNDKKKKIIEYVEDKTINGIKLDDLDDFIKNEEINLKTEEDNVIKRKSKTKFHLDLNSIIHEEYKDDVDESPSPLDSNRSQSILDR